MANTHIITRKDIDSVLTHIEISLGTEAANTLRAYIDGLEGRNRVLELERDGEEDNPIGIINSNRKEKGNASTN